MSHTLINRYLARELIAPSLLCLVIFTLVLMAGRLVKLIDLIINKGVAPGDIAILFATQLPPFLAIALPLAFLMGIMLGMGRLSADSETMALKAAGIGLGSIARLVLALACGCAVITAVLAWWGAPWGNRAFRSTLFEITSKKASIAIQPQIFFKQFGNLVMYADDIAERTGTMHGVLIFERKTDQEEVLIIADSGQMLSDPVEESVTLLLQNGTLHRQNAKPGDGGYQVVRFARYDIRPDLSAALTDARQPKRKPKEMTFSELRQRIASGEPQALAAHAEMHRRLCAPLAPLLFTLFSLPFSILPQRSGRGGGFVAGLLIYLIYYFLTSLAETLTTDAALSPYLTFWGLHLFLLIAGGFLLRQSALERPNRLLEILDGVILRLRGLRRRNAHP